jgi:hypothetical protein
MEKQAESAIVMYAALQGILQTVVDLDDPEDGWRDMDATDVDQHLASIWRLATDALVRVANNAEGGE